VHERRYRKDVFMLKRCNLTSVLPARYTPS